MSGAKIYTEEEVQELLRQGLALQEDSLSKERKETAGLSLEEIKSIAEEVGIDPSFIGLAAQKNHKKKDVEIEKGVLGQTKLVTLHREIEGDLSKSKIEEIVDHFRASHGQRGVLERVDDKFEWKSDSSGKPEYYLRGESHNGITDLKLEYRPLKGQSVGEIIPTFIPMVFPLFAIFAGAPFGVIIPFFLFAAFMTAMGFTATKKQFNKKEKRGMQKVERLLAISESIVQRGYAAKNENQKSKAAERIDDSLLMDNSKQISSDTVTKPHERIR